MDAQTQEPSMPQPVKSIPEGMHSLTPHLTIRNAAQAIEFYKKAFGAQELTRMTGPDGKSVWHAALRIGDSTLLMAEESVSMGNKSPLSLGGTPFNIQLYVEDANAAFQRAVSAGATVKMPLMDMFWGDRYGQVMDPFGFMWAISQRIKDMTPEELRKASEEAAKQFAQQQQQQ
jgi:PhnB protein